MLFRGLSVLDNLYLAARGITRGRLSFLRPREDDGALRSAHDLAHAVHLDSVGEQLVSELSHGHSASSRSAWRWPAPCILFDEPAAGLSPAERRELVQILDALPRYISFIIIEHDLDVALRVVDRVTVMHNGAIFKHGTPAEIQDDPDVQRIYLGGGRHG
jgi:branched-chain amino acid transport system ATP-binding protein